MVVRALEVYYQALQEETAKGTMEFFMAHFDNTKRILAEIPEVYGELMKGGAGRG